MSKIYVYARVSTQDRTLDLQKVILEAAGCDVVMLETTSGANGEGRPKLQLLLDVLDTGDVLIVTKLDRPGAPAGILILSVMAGVLP